MEYEHQYVQKLDSDMCYCSTETLSKCSPSNDNIPGQGCRQWGPPPGVLHQRLARQMALQPPHSVPCFKLMHVTGRQTMTHPRGLYIICALIASGSLAGPSVPTERLSAAERKLRRRQKTLLRCDRPVFTPRQRTQGFFAAIHMGFVSHGLHAPFDSCALDHGCHS